MLEARDISFSLPQRKKYHLGVAQYGTDINASTTTFSIFIRSPATNEVELEVPLSDFAYALRLPVPEKSTKQYNFCLLPNTIPASKQPTEPMIWTVPHGPVKTLNIHSTALSAIASQQSDSDDQILEKALAFVLSRHNVQLTQPSTEEFASATPESHRKKDTAYHVRAFRGSKDGFLFFLHNGIFFGFKKPLNFFAFENIESVSYTSVLQRTFNLNIAYREGGAADDELPDIQEIEFAMLDQADFPGIDAYIKKHGLQDASLAESRRATKVNAAANGKAVDQAASGEGEADDEDDGRTELEKAQQLLEDEEDEQEEDYDPSSDDESEGSDEDSSDEDEDEDDQQHEKERKRAIKSRDIVAEELGSEAEDVSITEDEEDEGEGEGEEEEGGEEEEYEEEEPEPEDVKPVVASGFASVAMTGPPPQLQHQGRWGHQQVIKPDPYDEDQL